MVSGGLSHTLALWSGNPEKPGEGHLSRCLELLLCSGTKYIISPSPIDSAATRREGAEDHQPPVQAVVCSAEDIEA